MFGIDQVIRYTRHSECIIDEKDQNLNLITSSTKVESPLYFSGELTFPSETARCLRAISTTVGSRFYIPPSMLERILREADPVITISNDMLRFEGFSSCCSAYARLDINKDGFHANKIIPGTTNVDFQQEMRSALSQVRHSNDLNLIISQNAFEMSSKNTNVIEKKVKLPLRWIKGFSEVQAMQTGVEKKFELNRLDAIKFIRNIPRGKSKDDIWLSSLGRSIRLAHRPQKEGVKLKGIERLKLIDELVPLCSKLIIYADESSSITCWALDIGPLRYTLALSSEPWRGFSGEGNLLKKMIGEQNEVLIAKVKASLNWQCEIQVKDLARQFNEKENKIDIALTILATRGLVGYDANMQCFFHRVLPFDIELVDQLNPRIKSAKKLIQNDSVTINKNDPNKLVIDALVKSNGITHQIKINDEKERCTCPWYGKYQGERGPCKHVLAVYMKIEEN